MARSFIAITIFIIFAIEVNAQGINEFDRSQKAHYWADSIISIMNLDEMIGQLFMVAAYSNRDSIHHKEIEELVSKYHVGGLIFFQGTPVAQSKLLNVYNSKAKVPLWIAMDGEWGVGMRLDSVINFPYQMTLGAIQDDDLIYDMGTAVARQFRRLGMQMNYAPVLDVNNNPANPVINFRSFGDNKYEVARKGIAYMKGLQDGNVIATGKHFPGHGDTDTDSHKDLPQINHKWDRLKSVELYPFIQAMEQGMAGIMVAHLNIPALDDTENLPSTLSPKIVNGLLRDSLQYEGLIFTDALDMKGVTKYYKAGEIEVKALQAGNDVLLFPQDARVAIEEIKKSLKNGTLSKQLVIEKCRKILRAKFLLNISNQPVSTKNLYDDLNSLQDQLLNRNLIRSALTVIKNEENILPISNLGITRIASLHIGFGEAGIFQEQLSKYTDVDHFVVDQKDLATRQNGILDSLSNYDLVIIGVENLSKWPFKNYGISDDLNDFLEKTLSENVSILCWWGSPYGLAKVPGFDLAKGIIISYQENELIRDFTAQLVFGGIGANGKLPVAINQNFASGSGLTTAKSRFSYMLPEEAGLRGEQMTRKIDSIVTMAIQNSVAPGIQVLVAKDQKVVFHKTYGYHRYDSAQLVTKTDIYDLASVTKITGALPALMRLHDQGLFDIDGTLGDYLPYFNKGNKKDIKLRRILSHNARLKPWIPYWTTTIKKNGKYKNKTLSKDSSTLYSIKLTDDLFLYNDYKSKIYKMIRKSELLENDTYVYSGLSFYLYPEIVSKQTNQDFEIYLKNTFFRPLGATTVTYNPYKYFNLDRIIPTEVDTFFRNVPLHGRVHDEGAAMMDGVSSNAGLFASTNDLAKIMQMYLNMGTYGNEQFISKNTMEKFTFCHYCEEGNRRGLAFDKPVLENKEDGSTAIEVGMSSFGHSGYTGTFVWADPESGILFVFMSNRVYPTRNNSKIYQLNIRPSIHQSIYDARIKAEF